MRSPGIRGAAYSSPPLPLRHLLISSVVHNSDHLVSRVNESFVDSFRTLCRYVEGAIWREIGDVIAFSTGLPFGLFNGCVVTEAASRDDLESGLAWVSSLEVPFQVWINEASAPRLQDVPLGYGLKREEHDYKGMVLGPPLPPAPPIPSNIRISDVRDVGIIRFQKLSIASGMPPDAVERMFVPSLAEDPDIRLFVTALDGEDVGRAIAIRTGVTTGVYNVGTLADARGRGVATASTWACVEAGRVWGSSTAVLQATPMALRLYERMGFETVVRYAEYRKRTQ